jgi:nucleoside triphosphate diphosphatase
VKYNVSDLVQLMERLRDPATGCPWDLAQDFASIVPSTLEECYELAAAIELGDYPHIAEELGDVLFQVVFYAQLGSEEQQFDFDDVVDQLVKKLIRRHPHVFLDGRLDGIAPQVASREQVKSSWEEIKRSERSKKSLGGVFDDVPLALPALPRAQKLQKRAAGVGFDWSSHAPVLDKLQEEIGELQAAIKAGSAGAIEEEMGDVLFTCTNLARHLKLDAEASLRRASQKFEGRFGKMETLAGQRRTSLESLDESALNDLWEEVKSRTDEIP